MGGRGSNERKILFYNLAHMFSCFCKSKRTMIQDKKKISIFFWIILHSFKICVKIISVMKHGPLVKWLRRHPLTVKSGVRLPYGSPSFHKSWNTRSYFYVPVAQLDRAQDSDSWGRRFESCRARHQKALLWKCFFQWNSPVEREMCFRHMNNS